MANNIVNNYSSTIVTIFSDVIKTYEMNLDIIKQTEGELNDLMHEIELGKPKNAAQGYKLYIEIRRLRNKRRVAKEEVELLKDMYDFLKSQTGQAFKSKIQSIQGNSVKLRTTQEQRTYTPRQRDDLTCTDKHSSANKPFETLLAEFNKTKITNQKGKLRK